MVLKPGLRHSDSHLDTQQGLSRTGPTHLELEPWRVSLHKKTTGRRHARSTEDGGINTREEANVRCMMSDYHGAIEIWS